MLNKTLALSALLAAAASPLAHAGTPCSDIQAKIEAEFKSKGVTAYTLSAVPADQVGDGKVVGTCEGGTKKIVYRRGTAATAGAKAGAETGSGTGGASAPASASEPAEVVAPAAAAAPAKGTAAPAAPAEATGKTQGGPFAAPTSPPKPHPWP
jgi:hypothetical protein